MSDLFPHNGEVCTYECISFSEENEERYGSVAKVIDSDTVVASREHLRTVAAHFTDERGEYFVSMEVWNGSEITITRWDFRPDDNGMF